MKTLATLLALGMLTVPALAATQTFKDAPVVDVDCHQKVAADPDAHTRACAMACVKSGYGIFTEDKKFLRFDAEGNAEIAKQLKASTKADHLRVNVTGDVEGDQLKVTTIHLE
ncbi:MAG TPA: hypothetical protein VG714_04525 [Acidobacteriaceae bacterium]|nr:hypothetical protein [Acidobacteriaceae bacterium]